MKRKWSPHPFPQVSGGEMEQGDSSLMGGGGKRAKEGTVCIFLG